MDLYRLEDVERSGWLGKDRFIRSIIGTAVQAEFEDGTSWMTMTIEADFLPVAYMPIEDFCEPDRS